MYEFLVITEILRREAEINQLPHEVAQVIFKKVLKRVGMKNKNLSKEG